MFLLYIDAGSAAVQRPQSHFLSIYVPHLSLCPSLSSLTQREWRTVPTSMAAALASAAARDDERREIQSPTCLLASAKQMALDGSDKQPCRKVVITVVVGRCWCRYRHNTQNTRLFMCLPALTFSTGALPKPTRRESHCGFSLSALFKHSLSFFLFFLKGVEFWKQHKTLTCSTGFQQEQRNPTIQQQGCPGGKHHPSTHPPPLF